MPKPDATLSMPRTRRWSLGRIAFLVALALTAALVGWGVTGRQWPHWLLELTSVL